MNLYNIEKIISRKTTKTNTNDMIHCEFKSLNFKYGEINCTQDINEALTKNHQFQESRNTKS